jgi:hypothetical protein
MDERAQNGQKIQKFENQRSDMDGVCGFRVLVHSILLLTKCEHARCLGKHTRIHMPARFPHQDAALLCS